MMMGWWCTYNLMNWWCYGWFTETVCLRKRWINWMCDYEMEIWNFWKCGANVGSDSGLVSIIDQLIELANWMDTQQLDFDALDLLLGDPLKMFFSFSLSFLFLFLSFKFTIFNHTHAPCVLVCVSAHQQLQQQQQPCPLCSASTTTTTTSCNPTCCHCPNNNKNNPRRLLNSQQRIKMHPPLSLSSLLLSPNAPPPPTTTTMRRTDSKARHSRWCWWSLNIPLRRHSPSQMFVTIFSFVFYFPYIFMFRAKKKIPETILLSSNPIQLHSYTVNIVSNFPSFLYYFIITLLSFNKTVVAPRRVRFHT